MARISLDLDQAAIDAIDTDKHRLQDEFNIADEDARGRGNIVTALIRHAIRNLPSEMREREEKREAAQTDKEAPILRPAAPPPREINKDAPDFADTLTSALSRKNIADIALDDLLNLVLVDENVTHAADTDLRHLAEQAPTTLAKRFDVPIFTANRLALVFEFGRRLAASHSDRVKITSPFDVADYLMPKMRHLQKEVVVTLCLDTKGGVTDQLTIAESEEAAYTANLISTAKIFEGTLNASVFHPREIMRYAIENSAASIILAHNHPSGDPNPSTEDIRATKQLIEAGNQIGIKVSDHVIIGDGIFYSLKEEGDI